MKKGQKKNPNRIRNVFKVNGKWVVDLTVNKKRVRKFFDKKNAAIEYLSNWKLARKFNLAYFVALPESQIKDIKDALLELPKGKSLLQSVRKAWQFFSESNLHELVDKYFEIKKTKFDAGKLSKDEYTHIKGRVANFKQSFASFADITPEKLYKYLFEKGGTKTISLWKGTISEILDLCVSRGAITQNPIKFLHNDELIKPETEKEIGILSVGQANDFMEFIEKKYPQYCRFYALTMFAGIRIAEAPRIKDEYFRYDSKQIIFPAKIGKVKKSWTLENLPDNLWAWLEKYKNTPIKRPSNTLRTKLGNYLSLPENFARHSFATYHLSLYLDPKRTAAITRNSEQMLKDHYWSALVAKDVAQQYFEILPK